MVRKPPKMALGHGDPDISQVLVGGIKGMVVEMKGTPTLCCTVPMDQNAWA